jgi:hypothetical protein
MPTADFRRVWTRCYDCHGTDYEATTNPDHVASGFSSQCEICHEMTGWTPAIMPDHDPFFPIYSGTHNNKWDTCADCHVVPGNYRVFECINCHDHNQPEMDSEHQGIPGYVYSSPACYQCHPTGEADDFEDHDAVFFPIFSGAHVGRWNDCADCHNVPNNRNVFTCTQCHDHNQSTMDPKHQGISDYVYSSQTCYQCHPTGEAGDFEEHDAAFFPIFSGTHVGHWNDCAICHPVPTDRNVFTCIQCHDHDRSRMDSSHLGEVRDYVYSATSCYDCHPDGREEDN